MAAALRACTRRLTSLGRMRRSMATASAILVAFRHQLEPVDRPDVLQQFLIDVRHDRRLEALPESIVFLAAAVGARLRQVPGGARSDEACKSLPLVAADGDA